MDQKSVKSFARRDHLLENEARIRRLWEDEKLLDVEAGNDPSEPHFMATFPYPYMNGMLHLGHAFTITKAEFATRYHALKGKRVSFPFGFHCTGMPIQASANKLKHEIEVYGCPPKKPVEETIEMEAEQVEEKSSSEPTTVSAAPVAVNASTADKPVGEFHGKRTKLVAKTGGSHLTQWEILVRMGIPEEEIPQFVDPVHWLQYFPPIGMRDLQRFGLVSDWRRSFITTSVNPYYDQFIRWQYLKLRESGKVDFGKRPSIYSPLDGQICADHDRSAGEGVVPQAYTCIKLRVLELNDSLKSLMKCECPVYLVAATLRPETMYGQTNCFVLPTGEYGLYRMNNNEVYVCSARSARNMSYQGFTPSMGEMECLGAVTGQQLLGLPLNAPLAKYDRVYVLPLLTISMTKGTGVVTCVPSDAPTDFAALRDLKDKPKLREKYGLTDDMVIPFELVEIIEVPEMGSRVAETVCLSLGIKSQNDTVLLEQAKEVAYKKGFYEGVMLVGQYAGKRVEEAKPMVQQLLIEKNEAYVYYEPNGLVMSRSGDECVVTYSDQWYLKYGESEWQKPVMEYIRTQLQTFNEKTRQAMESSCEWLSTWACSRQFGLGTKLPWDEQFVIESLSDSTIYMAYYTISHLLQGSINGDTVGPLGIQAEQMTPPVFDYIFCNGEYPPSCSIPQQSLDQMRKEFLYWYPYSLRVSGKDLIQNHLLMSLYHHQAIWPDMKNMPQGYFCNGHVLLNNEKMAKSTGNFMTLAQAIEQFGADATRLACADAGDTLDDANFVVATANSAILQLTTEEEWATAIMNNPSETQCRDEQQFTFFDRVFYNEMLSCVSRTDIAFNEMRFRDALQIGFYELLNIRNAYRDACMKENVLMEKTLCSLFVEMLCISLAPITPYFADNLWRFVLNKNESLWRSGVLKSIRPIDSLVLRQSEYMKKHLKSLRDQVSKVPKKLPKDWKKPNAVYVFCAREYLPWQKFTLTFLQESLNANGNTLPNDVLEKLKGAVVASDEFKAQMKDILAFGSYTVKQDYPAIGAEAFTLNMNFDEKVAFECCKTYIVRDNSLVDCQVFYLDDSNLPEIDVRKLDAKPGKPVFVPYFKAE